MKKISLSCLLLCLPLLASAGPMYRWVDENGRVHYTQTPPPKREFKEVAPAPPPSANPGMEAIKSYNEGASKTRSEAEKKQAETAKAQAEKSGRCQKATEYIQFLEGRPPVRIGKKNADGSISRMSEEDYNADLAKARKAAKESCA